MDTALQAGQEQRVNIRRRRIRVVVADDSQTALQSLCQYLEFDGGFEVVGTAGDGIQLLQQAERLRPELVLTDLSMPRMSGLTATKGLRESFPDMRIIIFTEMSGLSLREECLELPRERHRSREGGVINLRGEALPYVRLHDLLASDSAEPA